MPDQVVGGIVQPNVDLVSPMKSLADLQMAQSHAALFTAQARQANARQNALATAAMLRAKGDENGALNAIAAVDPELAKQMQSFGQDLKKNTALDVRSDALRKENPGMSASDRAITGQPEIQQTVAATEGTKATTAKTQHEVFIQKTGEMANRALTLFDQKDAGKITDEQLKQGWNKIIFEAAQGGMVNPLELNNLINSPDRAYAERARAMSITAKDYFDQSGKPAANKAEAELPAKTTEARNNAALEVWKNQNNPQHVAGDANLMVPQGGPMPPPQGLGGPLNIGYGPAQGTVQPPGPGAAPPPGPPAAPLQPAAIAPDQPPPIPGGPPVPGSPGPAMAAPVAPVPAAPAAVAPPTNIVPSKFGDVPIAPNLSGPAPPGTIKQGMTKSVEKLIERSGESAAKLIDVGDDAQINRDKTSRIISELSSGNVQTGNLAPYQRKVASWVYAITGGDLDAVKSVMGKDYKLPNAEALEKEFTQMGLQFARQTEGAREAVAAIRIALGGQPQMINTTEGNLKIARTLDAVAKWQSDRAQAAQDYGMAQAEKGQNGAHYVGFTKWWNSNHPVSEYTSKASPLALPKSARDYQPNTTYQGMKNGKPTPGIFNGYDASGQPKFKPVEGE